MEKTSSQNVHRKRERLFLLCAALAAACCIGLAVWFAPPKAGTTPDAVETTPMVQLTRVNLNTADLETLCLLPDVGEKRAQAILDYRREHGPFRRVADAANVPGLTESIVAEWNELAYVS